MKRISSTALFVMVTFLMTATLAHSDESNRCAEAPTVIEPVRSGPQLEALTKWIKSNEAELNRKFAAELPNGQTLSDYVARQGVYVVDANNDGIDEYIVTSIGGSGGYLSMWIFDKTPGGFRLNENDGPPKPKNITADGPWYLRAATNPFNADSDPLAGYGELFVRVCGKVYLTFTGWATGPSREAYIWENGATTDACNREWIDYNRDVFQQLYKAKRYAEAVRFLQGPLDQCGKRIDAKQRAWSYNDLALADFRLGDRQSCLDDVERAKSQMPATALNPSLEKAIAYNESLCKSGQMPVKADFGAFFKDASRNDQSSAWREEFENQILPAIVPDVEDDRSAQPHSLARNDRPADRRRASRDNIRALRCAGRQDRGRPRRQGHGLGGSSARDWRLRNDQYRSCQQPRRDERHRMQIHGWLAKSDQEPNPKRVLGFISNMAHAIRAARIAGDELHRFHRPRRQGRAGCASSMMQVLSLAIRSTA